MSRSGALIGYGTIAKGHHDVYLGRDTALEVHAVVDPIPERLNAAKMADPQIKTYLSIEELLDAQEIEFLDLCVPPYAHLDYLLFAVRNGLSVLCEKPFLLNTRDFEVFLDAMTSNDAVGVIYPSHNYKFSPVMRELSLLSRRGDLGEILRCYFQTFRIGHAVGVREWEPDWRREYKYSGGGILQDHATHSVYLAAAVCGSQPLSVSCISGNLNNDHYSATEDTALLILYLENGTEVHMQLTWSSARRHTSYVVLGDQSNVLIDNDQLQLSKGGKITNRSISSSFDDPTHKAWFGSMFEDFEDMFGNEKRQYGALQEAWMTCATIEAAYKSTKQHGMPVPIQPFPLQLS